MAQAFCLGHITTWSWKRYKMTLLNDEIHQFFLQIDIEEMRHLFYFLKQGGCFFFFLKLPQLSFTKGFIFLITLFTLFSLFIEYLIFRKILCKMVFCFIDEVGSWTNHIMSRCIANFLNFREKSSTIAEDWLPILKDFFSSIRISFLF